jgi:hypothetical protein
MRQKKALAICAVLIAVLSLSIAYAMQTLWTRSPTMLVYCKFYEAWLSENIVDCINPSSHVVNYWNRSTTNDHEYHIVLTITKMNQVDNGILTVTAQDVPAYLTVNISRVEIIYVWQPSGAGGLFKTLASNVPLGTQINFTKPDAIQYRQGPGDNMNFDEYHCIVITLLEYQVSDSFGVSTVNVNTTINLGVTGF